MNTIYNLTQHPASPDQLSAGVIDPSTEVKAQLVALITFDEIPSQEQLLDRAREVSRLIPVEFNRAMIGGAPFFQSVLEYVLRQKGIVPLHAFSKREVVETTNADGKVVKTAVFRHLGFVVPY